jgi:hypothetical protein
MKQMFLVKFKKSKHKTIRKMNYEMAKTKKWFRDLEWVEPL